MFSGNDLSANDFKGEQKEERTSHTDAEEECRNTCGPSNQSYEIFSRLSHLSCAVLAQAAKVLATTLEKLQHDFKETHQCTAKQPVEAARTFLEYCCLKALAQLTQHEKYLDDEVFLHLSFDFMVAWEAPLANDKDKKVECEKPRANKRAEDDGSLFFSDLMPLLVEVENTVGVEAFVRIAPCISIIADAISVHPQFETLTASTSGRLPFPVYDKYIQALEMSLRNMKIKNERSFLKRLPMLEEEHVMEIDGTSQMVIQHIGSKALTGRLTLTDHSLYFEPSSLVSHKEAIKYDLSLHIDHRVSKELAGPWGSRLFDNAISYHPYFPEQHTVFEFPEMMGSRRRDYWLAIIQEVIDTHKVIRKYNLESVCKLEALARSALGIARLQATRECMQVLIASPGALLTFNLAQNLLRGGDNVLEALSTTLKNAVVEETDMDNKMDSNCLVQKSFSDTLDSFKIWKNDKKTKRLFYKVKYGEPTLLQVAVEEARESSKYLHKAKEKEEEIKLDGIGTNITLIMELLRPVRVVLRWIGMYLSWDEPLYNIITFIVVAILILRGWLSYIIPILFAAAGVLVIWLRISGKATEHREVLVETSGGVTFDRVISAQRAASQIEELLQILNIGLLKLLAIFMPVKPEVAFVVYAVFLTTALLLVIVPMKYVVFALHLGLFAFTLRDKTLENKLLRRLREIWQSIPPVPVRMVESDDAHDEIKDISTTVYRYFARM